MASTNAPTTKQVQAPAPTARRWPQRLALGLVIATAMLGATIWYGGRESTLQMLAQRFANASGGKLTLTGVSGSLYGKMHIAQLVFSTPEQVVTADKIDLDWSPRQLVSSGIEVSSLRAASLRVETLRESPPSPMPATLAPPFPLNVEDVKLTKVVFVNKGASTEIGDIRLRLHGSRQQWQLRDAAASTPWGQVAVSGTIGARRPYKLDVNAGLSQAQAGVGGRAAQLKLHVGGDLENTLVDASGQAGRAVGDAHVVLAPYAAVPLRQLRINGRNIDPGFFKPSLPTADLSLTISARLDETHISGSVDLANLGAAGTLDQQRLPLRALRGRLGGSLASMQLSDVLLDFGGAGQFTGSGSVQRSAAEPGLGTASFTLHTDRFDLNQVHASMKPSKISGDLRVTNARNIQRLDAMLADSGLRLAAYATLADKVLEVREASLSAGSSKLELSGNAALSGDRPFKLVASASHFNPAEFSSYPQADINLQANASGSLAQTWKVDAAFALRSSRLFGHPLSGQGTLSADAAHFKSVDATLALGQNSVGLRGSFGAPGERLFWQLDGRQLDEARGDLYGAVTANGALTGTMAAPRTTFVVDARGLGWVAAQRKAAEGGLQARGEAWLAFENGKRSPELNASVNLQRFNPATVGSPLPGSINGTFEGSGRLGPNWHGAVALALQPSTLAGAPLWGHAKLAADRQRVWGADVDLHLGPNVLAVSGSFGSARDQLAWRIDAGQLGVLGADFGGALRGNGTLAGTIESLALTAALEGQDLRVPGKHSMRALRASANLGVNGGPNAPLSADVQISDYSSGTTRVAQARLQTSGTRAVHTLHLTARGDDFDALLDVRGGWTENSWNGTIGTLQNRGLYGFNLQAPVPLRIATPANTGFGGMATPEQVVFNGAVIRLPAGSINVESLVKLGPRWNSRGSATGVTFKYLAQVAPSIRDSFGGDLALGAQWALDLRTDGASGAAAMEGNVHVFRETGDLIIGREAPVALGLRQLDARAIVAGGALQVQLQVDGTRTGSASVDATAQLLQGRLGNDSPLRLTANADMDSISWLGPLAAQTELQLDGGLRMAVSGGGTIGAPSLTGSIDGDALAVRWPDQGVRLAGGELRAVFAGDQLQLQRLAFRGQNGNMVADGRVRFGGAEPSMQLKLVANKLDALSSPDRTVVVSGQATLVRDAQRFALEGSFRTDRALVELAPQGRPTLADDIVVLGAGASPPNKPEATLPLVIDLTADLGNDFRLRGMGIDANLVGSVRLRRVGSRAPRINGTIRGVSGTYAAYGQNLELERAVMSFSGAYDNPSLDIRAVRKRPQGEQLSDTNVEAGVQVRGTALAPQAKLVSTPNVSDSDKLSWLVLGHSIEGTSTSEADVLGTAAGALLGGAGGSSGLVSKLGVDELSFHQAATQGAGSAPGLANTVVMVGKRISDRLYLSFEQGASTTSSVVRLRYKVNPRVTLQFQTGTHTALDALYSWGFD